MEHQVCSPSGLTARVTPVLAVVYPPVVDPGGLPDGVGPVQLPAKERKDHHRAAAQGPVWGGRLPRL